MTVFSHFLVAALSLTAVDARAERWQHRRQIYSNNTTAALNGTGTASVQDLTSISSSASTTLAADNSTTALSTVTSSTYLTTSASIPTDAASIQDAESSSTSISIPSTTLAPTQTDSSSTSTSTPTSSCSVTSGTFVDEDSTATLWATFCSSDDSCVTATETLVFPDDPRTLSSGQTASMHTTSTTGTYCVTSLSTTSQPAEPSASDAAFPYHNATTSLPPNSVETLSTSFTRTTIIGTGSGPTRTIITGSSANTTSPTPTSTGCVARTREDEWCVSYCKDQVPTAFVTLSNTTEATTFTATVYANSTGAVYFSETPSIETRPSPTACPTPERLTVGAGGPTGTMSAEKTEVHLTFAPQITEQTTSAYTYTSYVTPKTPVIVTTTVSTPTYVVNKPPASSSQGGGPQAGAQGIQPVNDQATQTHVATAVSDTSPQPSQAVPGSSPVTNPEPTSINVPLPSNGQPPIIATVAGVPVSVGSSTAVVGGSTLQVGLGAQPTTVILPGGQTVAAGPGGVQIQGQATPAAAVVTSAPGTVVISNIGSGSSIAVIGGSVTLTFGANIPPATTTLGNGQVISIGPGVIILPSTMIIPPQGIASGESVTIGNAGPAAAAFKPTTTTVAGGIVIAEPVPNVVIVGTSAYAIGPGTQPTTVSVNGVAVSIGPSGVSVVGSGSAVITPAPVGAVNNGAQGNVVTLPGGIIVSGLSSSLAVIGGKTYTLSGPAATPTTLTISGKTISIGPSGVAVIGSGADATTVPVPAIEGSGVYTSNGVVISQIGSTAVVVGEKTYTIGPGVVATTATVSGVPVSIGPGGVSVGPKSTSAFTTFSPVQSTAGSKTQPAPAATTTSGGVRLGSVSWAVLALCSMLVLVM